MIQLIQTTVIISKAQQKYIQENFLNLSKFLRHKLDEEIEKNEKEKTK